MWSSYVQMPSPNNFVGDAREETAHLFFHVVGRRFVVLAPHHHGHEAYLAVTDPAEFVLPSSEW
jgi:hypothetical protein